MKDLKVRKIVITFIDPSTNQDSELSEGELDKIAEQLEDSLLEEGYHPCIEIK